MKRGFTLIELLAVIVILAIILAIAIPAISSVIDNSKINAYKNNTAALVKYAKVYLINNSDKLPINIGDTSEITLDNLKDSKLLSNVQSPFDKSKECNGYILVTKLGENNYDYSPNLNCTTNIASSADDQLEAYYKFDDFQEPTQNLAAGTLATYLPYSTLTRDSQDINLTMVPGGVQFITLHNGTDYNGKILSLSGYIFKNGIPHTLPGDRSNTYHTVPAIKWNFNSSTGKFEIVENFNSSSAWLFHTHSGTIVNDVITIKNFQVEEKPYATPFTPNSRGGIVKDYSGKNNNATLDLTTTPKWISNSKIGTGAYEFNGTDKYINAGNGAGINLTNKGTVSLWVKTSLSYPSSTSSTAYKGIIAKSTNGGSSGQSYYIDWYGTNSTRTLRGSIGDSTGENIVLSNNYNFNNDWNYITLVWNGTNVILYSNGLELGRTNQTKNAQILSNNLEIGRAFSNNIFAWNGSIDDVRVYSRALSSEEVKILYESTK